MTRYDGPQRAKTSPTRRGRAWLVRLLAITLMVTAVGVPNASAPQRAAADTAPPTGLPTTVSSDPLPTAQINGVVWSQVVVGNTVYAGGQFTRARPAGAAAGTQEVVRNNLVAYNLSTGVMTSFAPNVNGVVQGVTASPDGSVIYAVGQFTQANGVNRYRIAAFTPSGTLITSFAPVANGTVYGIATTASTVYVGGVFSSINSVARGGVAAINSSNGALRPFTATQAGGSVRQVIVSPDASKVVVGGNFTSMNGSSTPGYGLAMLDATTGSNLQMPVNSLIRNAGSNSAIYSLAGNANGFYGAGYVFSQTGGNLEGAFKANWNGEFQWVEDCHGDSYSVFPSGNEVYVAGHPHYCGNIGGFPQTDPRANWTYQRGLAFTDDARGKVTRDPYSYFNFEGNPRPALLHWLPDMNTGTFTGQSQGPWSVSGNSSYVTYAGEFTRVNNVPQQGMVRFARTNLAPNNDGPRLGTTSFVPTVTNFAEGVRVSWESNYDRDNEQLSYDVIKNGNVANPIFSTTSRSAWWQRPNLGYVDQNVTAGESYSYQVRATDPKGNSVSGNPISITATRSGTALSGYDQVALGDGPQSYWAFNEGTTGSTAADLNGVDPGTRSAGVIGGVPGAIPGHPSTAFRFVGNSTSFVSTTGTARKGPQVFSMEAWFKTTTTAGGKIIGFGNRSTGNSTSYDRHLYMSSNGRLYLGVNPDGRTINTTTSYNDGNWHHVVATLSQGGLRLYVDGVERAANPNIVDASALLEGYWRVGGDALGTWTGASGGSYFNGDIDNPAIYRVALTPGQVAAHYAARTGAVPNEPPVADFSHTANDVTAAFDASDSSDPDGSIDSYAWNFGDGDSGTGMNPSHAYDTPGTYPVTLTVTDNDDATGSVTRSVTVTANNQSPTAAFTTTTQNLTANFNATGSDDPDGTIGSYAWTFGDGGTATGVSPSRTYSSAGTYPVTLTVTDNDGASDSVTQNVTVTAPPNPGDPFVNDPFNRTLASGLGTADVGGPWTVSAASDFGVGSGAGLWKLSTPGVTRSAYLGATLRDSTDLVLNLSADKNAAGGTTFAHVEGRRVSANTVYRGVLRFTTSNSLSVGIEALKGSATSTVLAAPVTVGSISPGTQIHVRMQTFGTNSTTIRAKVWLGAANEPAAWTVTSTDSFGPLQAPGAVGLVTYVSGAATNTPVTVSVSDIVARPMP